MEAQTRPHALRGVIARYRWLYTAFALLEIVETWHDFRGHDLYWYRVLTLVGLLAAAVTGWVRTFQQRRAAK